MTDHLKNTVVIRCEGDEPVTHVIPRSELRYARVENVPIDDGEGKPKPEETLYLVRYQLATGPERVIMCDRGDKERTRYWAARALHDAITAGDYTSRHYGNLDLTLQDNGLIMSSFTGRPYR